MVATNVTVDAIDADRHMHIDLTRGGVITVLEIRATGGREMAARAHFVGRLLRRLSSCQSIYPLGWRELNSPFLVPDHRPRIVRAVTDQTVDIVQIFLGGREIGLGSETGVTLSTTTWLCR